jgi:hygromycin-B 4-O-kinase
VHDPPPDPSWDVSDAKAEAFLAARFHAEPGAITRISHGEWSKAYAFRGAGRDYVARFSALREDFAKDHLAMRHASPALPIPRILEIGEAFAGFYAISERAVGRYLDDLDDVGMRPVLPSLFAALDAARLADLSDTTGFGAWGADASAPHPTWQAALLDVADDPPARRTHGWRQRLTTSPLGSGPFEEAFARLRALAAYAPHERSLVHGDLLNFNVLVADDRVSAVIDWGCSMYGDFLYDVAWFAFWAPWYPAWRGIDFPGEAARHYESIGLDVPHFAERLRLCQLHIGLDNQAYCAFKGRWDQLEATARRTLDAANGLLG